VGRESRPGPVGLQVPHISKLVSFLISPLKAVWDSCFQHRYGRLRAGGTFYEPKVHILFKGLHVGIGEDIKPLKRRGQVAMLPMQAPCSVSILTSYGSHAKVAYWPSNLS